MQTTSSLDLSILYQSGPNIFQPARRSECRMEDLTLFADFKIDEFWDRGTQEIGRAHV